MNFKIFRKVSHIMYVLFLYSFGIWCVFDPRYSSFVSCDGELVSYSVEWGAIMVILAISHIMCLGYGTVFCKGYRI